MAAREGSAVTESRESHAFQIRLEGKEERRYVAPSGDTIEDDDNQEKNARGVHRCSFADGRWGENSRVGERWR